MTGKRVQKEPENQPAVPFSTMQLQSPYLTHACTYLTFLILSHPAMYCICVLIQQLNYRQTKADCQCFL